MIHVSVETEQKGTRFHHTTQKVYNLKFMKCLFSGFLFNIFSPWLTMFNWNYGKWNKETNTIVIYCDSVDSDLFSSLMTSTLKICVFKFQSNGTFLRLTLKYWSLQFKFSNFSYNDRKYYISTSMLNVFCQ